MRHHPGALSAAPTPPVSSQGVGGGPRDVERRQHQRWMWGRVQLIRQKDCNMYVNYYKSPGRWIELYSRGAALQRRRARLHGYLRIVILSCGGKNKMILLLLYTARCVYFVLRSSRTQEKCISLIHMTALKPCRSWFNNHSKEAEII